MLYFATDISKGRFFPMFRFTYKDIDFSYKLDTANDPADDYTRHMHPFHEIIYFIGGDVTYTVEDESAKLAGGDFLFIPSGKYHFADINRDKLYERYVLQFPPSVLPDFLAGKMRDKSPFLGCRKELGPAFSQLDSYFTDYSGMELYTLFLCELVKILILVSSRTAESRRKSNEILSPIIRYIDENLHEPITLESLSVRFNYSKSYISSEFNKQMHISIMRYIRTKKIMAAHNMLLSGKKKGEVAEAFGFRDYSTFYRAYISVMGTPPSGQR